MAEREIEDVVEIDGDDVVAGRLWSHRRGPRESQSFSYTDAYLARPGAYSVDLSLPLVSGQQQTGQGRATFGAVADSAPDRWGWRLIDRAGRLGVRRSGRRVMRRVSLPADSRRGPRPGCRR